MRKRGVLASKKAMGVIMLEAAQLVGVGLILVSTLAYVQDKLSPVGFYKTFYSRDFGLMTTAIYGVPGNIYEIYGLTPKGAEGKDFGFYFEVGHNMVMVNATDSPKQRLYWYFSDSTMKMESYDEALETKPHIQIGKIGDTVKIGPKISFNKNVIACPPIDTEDKHWLSKNFIFDPGHRENETDKGAVSSSDPSLHESEITKRIVSFIVAHTNIGNYNLTIKAGEEHKSLEQRQQFVAENSDAGTTIISVHVGQNDDSRVYVKAYYNAFSDYTTRMKSRKLGCTIANAIAYHEKLAKKQINGVAVIPSESEYIQKIIPKGKVGVLLEIGNINMPKDNNIVAYEHISDIGNAIYYGLLRYHED